MERRRIPPSLVKGNVSYEYVSDGGALKRSLTCRIKLRHCNCRRCRHCATTFLFLSFPFLPPPPLVPAARLYSPFPYLLPPPLPFPLSSVSVRAENIICPSLASPPSPYKLTFRLPGGSGGDHFIPER